VDLLGAMEPPPASLAHLGELSDRLLENRLHIAVLGQFKRGKSSLLNALIGAEILPTAVLPLTSVPIFITSGRPLSMRVHYRDGKLDEDDSYSLAEELRGRLQALATEEGNPHNRLGVERIEVRYPTAALVDETVLIDTPGIGSTHHHNTDTTLHLLPQCDAGLFILSPDPPITETEITFLDTVKAQVPRLVFILNKIDILDSVDRGKVVGFLKSVLQERLGSVEPPEIHCLSARQALAARCAGDAALMAESGLPSFEDQVIRPLARQKSILLQAALTRRVQTVLAEARLEVSLAIGALRMPLDQLAKCLASFHQLLPQFEAQRQAAQDLLAGDRKRVLAALEDEAERLRRRASHHLEQVIDTVFASRSSEPEATARDALVQAIPLFFDRELSGLSTSFDAQIRGVFFPHQKRAADLFDAVRRAAAELFDLPWRPSTDTEFLDLSRQPYWVTQEMAGALIPLGGGSFDWLLPRAKRMERLRGRLLEDADKMVARNVENLRWATLQNVETAFRRFGSELDRGLTHVIEATHGSIAAAYERRHAEAGRIDPQVAHLSIVSERLTALTEQVGTLAVGESTPAGWA
jgi:hypothetical protein